MNLRQTIGKNRRTSDAEVNITPVMNIFVILIPFLLLTATFVRVAIIDLTLPTLEDNTPSSLQEQDIQDLTVLMISILPEGFQIKTSEKTYPVIKKKGGEYNYQKLREQLQSLKSQYPRLEDVILSPSSDVLYQVIVHVLDHCREVGFPNYSISG